MTRERRARIEHLDFWCNKVEREACKSLGLMRRFLVIQLRASDVIEYQRPSFLDVSYVGSSCELKTTYCMSLVREYDLIINPVRKK